MGLLSWFCMNLKRNRADKSWCDLPIDIINLIMDHLSYADRIRFRAVCKTWRLNTRAVKYADQLPWVFVYNYELTLERRRKSVCYLYDPSHKRKYTKKIKLFDPTVHASKYGWMLISEPKISVNPSKHCCNLVYEREEHFTGHSLMFFYSPFTDKIIQLPEKYKDGKATFSASPTSPECVVFLLREDSVNFLITCSTWSPGDKTWTTHCFNGFCGCICGLAYMEGILYCLLREGTLASFEVATKNWKILLHFNPIPGQFGLDVSNCLIDESDGKLLIILRDNSLPRRRVLRLDFSEMICFEVESLDNKLLFLGRTSMSVTAVGKLSDLANTIHHVNMNDFHYEFYKAPESDRSCPRPYAWIKESDWLRKIWIQPPQSFY